MENKELIEKLIAMQGKIMPALDRYEAADELPHDLRKAKENVVLWTREVEREGTTKDPHEWPVKQFAQALRKHIAMFDDHTVKDRIREYEELVGKMPYNFDKALR